MNTSTLYNLYCLEFTKHYLHTIFYVTSTLTFIYIHILFTQCSTHTICNQIYLDPIYYQISIPWSQPTPTPLFFEAVLNFTYGHPLTRYGGHFIGASSLAVGHITCDWSPSQQGLWFSMPPVRCLYYGASDFHAARVPHGASGILYHAARSISL